MTKLEQAARQALDDDRSLYDITGNITDINTLLINRGTLRDALAEQALQKMADNEMELGLDYMGKPIAWLYPEGLEALKSGKCWTAYGTKQDEQCSIPVYLNDAVAPRVEPAATQSGGGFESLPASPQAQHQEALNKFAEDSVWDGEGP